VRNYGRVGWVGHGADRVVPLLVAPGNAGVLAEVVLPGCDNKLLQDPAGLAAIATEPQPRCVLRGFASS
jgi:hypothetical protein